MTHKIKKLMFTAAVLFSLDSTAMNPNMVREYTVNTSPRVTVLQTSDKINFGFTTARSIQIQCRIYNGIPTHGPLNMSYDMTEEQIRQALMTFFGPQITIAVKEYQK